MYALLLPIIYLAFISLGLPDSLLGSTWPVMQHDLNVPLSYAGIIAMIIAGGTVVSSLISSWLSTKLSTALITAYSVLLTALALLGFSMSDSFWMLCLLALPYGLGAGAVDATLNLFVATHYAARHMNWLHCFWGVGVSASPFIMSYSLISGGSWQGGYFIVAMIQFGLSLILFLSLPLWKKSSSPKNSPSTSDAANAIKAADARAIASIAKASATVDTANRRDKIDRTDALERPDLLDEQESTPSILDALRQRGSALSLIATFAYCGVEASTGLWASSYLVAMQQLSVELAASYASLFFIGITLGRFISGFLAEHYSDTQLIFAGIALSILGCLLICPTWGGEYLALAGLITVGLGCAPIFPSILHAIPSYFGLRYAKPLIGLQMASAYVGCSLAPPLFGLIADAIGISYYPYYILILAILMLAMMLKLQKKLDDKS